jgi:hypothetical protein
MGVHEGDHVAFVERGGEMVLRPVRQSLRDLRGSVAVDGPQDFEAVRAAVQSDRAARLAASTDALTGQTTDGTTDAPQTNAD